MKHEKKIVMPGSVLDRNIRLKASDYIVKSYGRGLVSTLVGVIQRSKDGIELIPYKCVYKPKKGDYVIGAVVGYAPNGWIIDIGSYTKAFLPAADVMNHKFDPKKDELSKYLSVGDIVGIKIQEARRIGYLPATIKGSDKDKKYGKIEDYYIIKVSTTKLPRIIGRKGSMIKLIKQKIDGELIIAQNGVILYKGSYENYILLKKIINLIVAKTFASGLTDAVAEILNTSKSEAEKRGE